MPDKPGIANWPITKMNKYTNDFFAFNRGELPKKKDG